MRDEDDAHAAFATEAGEQVHDLLLDGDVERGGRFVGDEDLRVAGEGHGDHRALLHAAGKLVGILVRDAGGVVDVDFREGADDFGADILDFRAVEGDGFADLETDRVDGIQGAARFLEDVGDGAAADFGQLVLGQGEELDALQAHGAAEHATRGGREEAREGQGGDGLAGAGFTDDRQHLAGRQLVAYPLGGDGLAVTVVEGDAEVLDFQERLGGHGAEVRSGAEGGEGRTAVIRCASGLRSRSSAPRVSSRRGNPSGRSRVGRGRARTGHTGRGPRRRGRRSRRGT